MASPALEKLWAEQAAQRKANGYTPTEYIPPDTTPRVLGVRITEDEDKSFGQKMLQDGALLSYGALTGVAKLGSAAISLPLTPFSEKARETVKETGKMVAEGFKQTAVDIAGVTGVLGKEQQRESIDYYKAHPMMAMLDIWGVASLGTGTALKSALTGTARGAMGATMKAGIKMGIKEELMTNAFQISRSFLSPARVVGATEKIAYPLERALNKAVRTGNVDEVASAITTKLIKNGVDEKKAFELGQIAAKETADNISRQATKLKTLDSFTHPASAAFRGGTAITTKIGGNVLGKADEAAVTSLFGNKIIDSNKKSAVMLERWLEAVAGERGWENTLENRTRVLQEIKSKSEFVNLSPDEFFSHFDNYVKSDITTSRLRQMTNNPSFVPVRTISKDSAESMAQTLESNFDDIAQEAMGAATVGVENVIDKSFANISEFMNRNFGRDFKNFEVQLRRAFGEKGNKESLIAAIRDLSEGKPHLTGEGWSKEATNIIEDMKGTGYQVGIAPTGKKVSLAAELVDEKGAEKISTITESTLDSNRKYLGRIIDDWGLSFKGVVEGTSQFMFRQSWGQHAFKEVGEKFGNIITIKRPVTGIKGIREIKIPVGRLFEWLDDHKQEFFAQRAKGVGVLPQFQIRTVFDITIDDLVKMGFNKDIANTISSISKKSLREIPVSVTGIADKLVNVMRGADGVFKGFGEFYDKWAIKTPTYMRYQSPLSFMFQAQQFIETKIMGAMLTKDISALPGVEKLAGFGERLIPSNVSGILSKAKTYLKEITAEPSLNDLAIVRDELITDVQKVINDSFGTSEFQSVTRGAEKAVIETGAEVLRRTQRDSLWMRAFGGFHMNTGAKIAKGIAKKFGMTIEEAVSKNADGNYLHPRLVREMQDTVRASLTYSHGFQTSPLVKTMNVIWFPFRFQTKTIQTTANWLSELSPVSRAVVINNWVNFSNWAGTDEGIEWRKTHQNLLYSILAYTTAAEQIGDSIDAVSRGQLFGGNTGLIGGIPFGFVYNLASELALLPEDPEQFDPATGKNFQFKKIPKEVISYGTFVKSLEEFIFMMAPGMPLYTVSGGVIRGASYRHMIQKIVEDSAGWAQAKVKGVDPKLGKTLLEREFIRIRPGESRY